MRCRPLAIVLSLFAWSAVVLAQPGGGPPRARFVAFDLLIDTHGATLGAYQVRIESASGDVTLVGVEGGTPGTSFADPPVYDPRALSSTEHGDRIILGAYTLKAPPAANAPIRVARIHVLITGDAEPDWSVTLDAAADAEGKPITTPPTVSLPPTGDTP